MSSKETGETLVVTKRGRPAVRIEPSNPPIALSGSVKLLVDSERFVEPLDIAWDAERGSHGSLLSMKALVIKFLPIVFVLFLGTLYGVAGIVFGPVGIKSVSLGTSIGAMIFLLIFLMRLWWDYLDFSSHRKGSGSA